MNKFYGFTGDEVTETDKNAVAKSLFFEDTKTSKFFVKVCSHGPESGLFFNPQVHHKETLYKFDNDKGRDRFSYRAVNKEAFDLYVKFLKTGNVSLLRNAQRSV